MNPKRDEKKVKGTRKIHGKSTLKYLDDVPEEEVIPGVFMTDFRTNKKPSPKILVKEPVEKQVLPGVFVTDFRKERDQKIEKELSEQERQFLMETIVYKERVVMKLFTTNREIMEFDPNKKDPDFQSAIKENKEWILKHTEVIKSCRKKLGLPLVKPTPRQVSKKRQESREDFGKDSDKNNTNSLPQHFKPEENEEDDDDGGMIL